MRKAPVLSEDSDGHSDTIRLQWTSIQKGKAGPLSPPPRLCTNLKNRGWCSKLFSSKTRRLSLCSCSILCFCTSASSMFPSSRSLGIEGKGKRNSHWKNNHQPLLCLGLAIQDRLHPVPLSTHDAVLWDAWPFLNMWYFQGSETLSRGTRVSLLLPPLFHDRQRHSVYFLGTYFPNINTYSYSALHFESITGGKTALLRFTFCLATHLRELLAAVPGHLHFQ